MAARPSGYSYQWWANDTAGNTNQTSTLSYIINKAAQALSITVSPTDLTYPVQSTVTATTTGAGTVSLTRGGSPVSNPDVATLAAGTYVYKKESNSSSQFSWERISSYNPA